MPSIEESAAKWIRFLRKYGDMPSNDNQRDEAILRVAKRTGIQPIRCVHPMSEIVKSHFQADLPTPRSIVLTGSAGDGKTYVCGELWRHLGGDERTWMSDSAYYSLSFHPEGGRPLTVHFLRDLTGLQKFDPEHGKLDDEDLLIRFCRTMFGEAEDEIFIIAANGGQILERWRKLPSISEVQRARELFETLLVEGREETNDARLRFFNFSVGSSADLLGRVLKAFLAHEGWQACRAIVPDPGAFFGPNCPIRRNFEILQDPLFQERLRTLFELCDHNRLHIPIRQIILLLVNGVLGHPDVKDKLMVNSDVPSIISKRSMGKASIYRNILGANLSEERRERLAVFDYLERFRIGQETSNRIDNLLIFGAADEDLKPNFDRLVANDPYYGAGRSYLASQLEYIEGDEENETQRMDFLNLLVGQRQRLFFTIPPEFEEEMKLWELSVFKYAGQYLNKVVRILEAGERIERPFLSRIIRGLNRVFVGMLVASDQELYLATSLSYSNAKVSRLLEDKISVSPRLGEKVEIILHEGFPTLVVVLSADIKCRFDLHLVRYEFLCRVAEGALPSSFSRECHEDLLAFKSRILTALGERRQRQGEDHPYPNTFRLLKLDDSGNPTENVIEVLYD